jgi:phage gp29-like protein
MIAALQDAIGKGYSVVEPRWEYEAGALRPIEYKHRDPRFFRYDEIGLDDLCLMEDSGLPGLKLVAPYFIVHEPWLAAGPPIRRGLARSAAWAFLVQTFALEDWVAFAEVYGFPFRFGKYHPSATAADKATLLRAVRDIANDAAAIIPEGMAIEFMESKAERGEAVFGALMSYVDRKISMIVVGQTMTAEDGSSLAQAQVHNEVRHDITRADARQTAATVNRGLIRPAVAMNFGPQDVYPLAQLEMPENADLTALGGFLRDAVPLGLKVSQSWTRKMASIPDPQPDDELLGVNTSLNEIRRLRAEKMSKDATTPPGDQDDPQGGQGKQGKARLAALSGCGCPLCGASATLSADDPNHVTAIDETDALIDEALADWREIRDPLLAGLLAAVGKAETFEEALANIETAKIDTGPLIECLAIATAKARGLGDVRD